VKVRLYLYLFTAASLATFVWQLHALLSNPAVTFYAERSLDSIRVNVERELILTADQTTLAKRLALALDETPADWAVIDMLVTFAEERQITLPEALSRELESRRRTERSLSATSKECLKCVAYPQDCAFSSAKLCDVVVELTPLGDLRSITRAINDRSEDKAVDQIDLGLALVGLGATAASAVTLGSSYTVKAGASLIKTARTSGRLSKPMTRFVEQNTAGLLDFKRLPTNWYLRPSSLKDAVDPLRLARLQSAGSDLGTLQSKIGTMETLRLLKHIDTPEELRALRRSSEALERRLPLALEVLGKQRLIKQGMRWSQASLQLAGAAFGVLLGLFSLLWSSLLNLLLILKNIALHKLRASPGSRLAR